MSTTQRRTSSHFLAAALVTLVSALPAPAEENKTSGEDKESNVGVVRVAFKNPIRSQVALRGETVEAVLRQDLISNHQIVAPEKSIIVGRIESVTRPKKPFRLHSAVRIVFDHIVTPTRDEIPIIGVLPRQLSVFNGHGGPRQIEVSEEGEVIRAQTLNVLQIPEFDLSISEKHLDFKNKFNVNIQPGDEINVRAELPDDTSEMSLSGSIMKKETPSVETQR